MRIGSYQVLLELGRGGMGAVYLGRAVGAAGFERLVAIKRVHPHLLSWRGVPERFLDEARVAALVHHANVVSTHQVGEDEEGQYLVFDYVEGESFGTLLERMERRGVSQPSAAICIRVVLDALAGLHAAHEAVDTRGAPLNLLHRDVSTQNLLVGCDGVTRLTDFGIAKSALSSVVTDDRHVHGKLLYSPPEYLQRQPVDRTLDVYGMGMTLWTALTGQSPWPGLDGGQLIHAIIHEPLPELGGVRPDLPEAVAQVVARACARDPRQRFQTASDMHDALERAARDTGLAASYRDVAEWVQQVAGDELRSRRQALQSRRRELAPVPGEPEDEQLEQIQTLPVPAREVAAPHARAPEPRALSRQSVLAGAVIVAAIAAGVLLALSEERRPAGAARAVTRSEPAEPHPASTPNLPPVAAAPVPEPVPTPSVDTLPLPSDHFDASISQPPGREEPAERARHGRQARERRRHVEHTAPSAASDGIATDNPYR